MPHKYRKKDFVDAFTQHRLFFRGSVFAILFLCLHAIFSIDKIFNAAIARSRREIAEMKKIMSLSFLNQPQQVGRLVIAFENIGIGNLTTCKDVFSLNDKSDLPKCDRSEGSEENRIKALLENIFLSGGFGKARTQKIILGMGKTFGVLKRSPLDALNSVHRVMEDAGAYQSDFKKFNAEYLMKNLFHSRNFDDKDAEDFIFCTTQSTYSPTREILKVAYDDSEDYTYRRKKFLENAKKFGVVNPVFPIAKADEIWILGSSRSSAIKRISFIKKNYGNNLHDYFKKVRIVTRYRRLWAEFDGIATTSEDITEEGLGYIALLARKNGILPKAGGMFVDGRNKEVKHITLNSGNKTTITMFNDNGEVREALMMEEAYEKIMKNRNFEMIDVGIPQRADRETTVSTAANNFADLFSPKKYQIYKNKKRIIIAVVSSQPFLLRQGLAIQIVAKQYIKRYNIDAEVVILPMGPGLDLGENLGNYKQHGMLPTIYQEMVALLSEGYASLTNLSIDDITITEYKNSNIKPKQRKRTAEDLMRLARSIEYS